MAGDAAKHAALLIALGGKPMKGKPSEATDHGDEKEHDDIESAAADDMFDALKSSDRSSFRDALDRYVKACVTKAMGDEDDEDEEAPESGDYKDD